MVDLHLVAFAIEAVMHVFIEVVVAIVVATIMVVEAFTEVIFVVTIE